MTDPSEERGAQPNISPDGKWVWDGHNWVPNPHPAPPQPIPEYPEPFTPAEPEPVEPHQPPPVAGRPGMTYPAPGQSGPGGPPVIAPTPPYTPVKKSNVLRNIVLSCVVLAILMISGCAIFLTVAVKQVGDEINKQVETATTGGGSQGQQLTVRQGKSFELDGLTYPAGWRVARNELGMMGIERLRFENTRDEETTVVIRMEVLDAGEVVATVHCTSSQVPPGETGVLECLGADEAPQEYDNVRVTDLF